MKFHFELVIAKARIITTSLARRFWEMDPAPGDRLTSERRMQMYERILRQGGFHPPTWASATCEETGGEYRVNGKHTSGLFLGLAAEFPGHTAIIEKYKCRTLEDVSRLYGTFDSAIMSRRAADINRSVAATVTELADVPATVINACVSGIAQNMERGAWRNVSNRPLGERAEALFDHTDFVLWVNSVLGAGDQTRHIRRQGVICAMFDTFQKNKAQATAFWCAVRDETGPRPTNPDRALARWLLTTIVTSKANARSKEKKKADAREFYVNGLIAWNAFRESREIKAFKYRESMKVPKCV